MDPNFLWMPKPKVRIIPNFSLLESTCPLELNDYFQTISECKTFNKDQEPHVFLWPWQSPSKLTARTLRNSPCSRALTLQTLSVPAHSSTPRQAPAFGLAHPEGLTRASWACLLWATTNMLSRVVFIFLFLLLANQERTFLISYEQLSETFK